MICIDNRNTDIYFNLSAEEYLFSNFNEDVFMMWQSEPSVIIGKYQDVSREVNIPYSKKKNINIARRFSGGGSVYHDLGNINFSFISEDKYASFRKYAEQIAKGLKMIGINADIDERNSIWLNEYKISGSAQFIRKNRQLFHATLLFSADLNCLNKVLESSEKDKKLKPKYSVLSRKSPVTNVNMHLDIDVDVQGFKQLFFDYILNSDAENSHYSFNNRDIDSIDYLSKDLYRTKEWTMDAIKKVNNNKINLQTI